MKLDLLPHETVEGIEGKILTVNANLTVQFQFNKLKASIDMHYSILSKL